MRFSLSTLFFALICPFVMAENPNIEVVEVDSNFRVVEQKILLPNENGESVLTTNRITELGTGLYFFEDDQWKESRAEISLLPNGNATARKGAHKVTFKSNIQAHGALEIQEASG